MRGDSRSLAQWTLFMGVPPMNSVQSIGEGAVAVAVAMASRGVGMASRSNGSCRGDGGSLFTPCTRQPPFQAH